MQKFKFKQKKNMELREYMRKEKDRIIAERSDSEKGQASEDDHQKDLSMTQHSKGGLESIKPSLLNYHKPDKHEVEKKLHQEKVLVK